jgi:hypothetical protein
MHDPVGFATLGSPSFVEDKCLLHPERHRPHICTLIDISIFACDLPVASLCGSISPRPCWVLTVPLIIEVAHLLIHVLRHFTMNGSININSQLSSMTEQIGIYDMSKSAYMGAPMAPTY